MLSILSYLLASTDNLPSLDLVHNKTAVEELQKKVEEYSSAYQHLYPLMQGSGEISYGEMKSSAYKVIEILREIIHLSEMAEKETAGSAEKSVVD